MNGPLRLGLAMLAAASVNAFAGAADCAHKDDMKSFNSNTKREVARYLGEGTRARSEKPAFKGNGHAVREHSGSRKRTQNNGY